MKTEMDFMLVECDGLARCMEKTVKRSRDTVENSQNVNTTPDSLNQYKLQTPTDTMDRGRGRNGREAKLEEIRLTPTKTQQDERTLSHKPCRHKKPISVIYTIASSSYC